MKIFLAVLLWLVLSYALTLACVGTLLWLVSLILPYTFSWVHALALAGIFMILRFLFGHKE